MTKILPVIEVNKNQPGRIQYPELHAGDYQIRLARQNDVMSIVDYCSRNRKFHTPWEPLRPKGYYTSSFWKLQVDRNLDDFHHGRAVRLYVFHEQGSEILAYISFTNFVRGAGHFCTLGYNIDEQLQGRGLMLQCVPKSLDYVSQNLGIHRVMANYMPRNLRSAKLLKRIGFVVEGYARDFLMINGKWEDHIMSAKIFPDHSV